MKRIESSSSAWKAKLIKARFISHSALRQGDPRVKPEGRHSLQGRIRKKQKAPG